VLDSLRYVEVQDLATGGDHIPELGDVYVDVALVSRAPQPADGPVTGPAPGSAPVPATGDAPERHSLSDLLDRRPPAVLALVGQPGSGKTTLLGQAARHAAGPAVRGPVGRRRVPVLVALREQAGSVIADPTRPLPAVIRAAVGDGPGREPGGWWERQLRRGRCLILLDGLDEVARAEDARAVADWIQRQIAAYPGNHFVVTSRSAGPLGPLAGQADVLVVRPFTTGQVQLFLDRWFLAAEQHATGAAGPAARRAVRLRARESAARLAALLREYPALYDLAVNPLLATMIATAHRYRGALPGSRADLYGEICQVLLSRRGQAKGLPELLPWTAKEAVLAALAYQMMREHASALPADRVLAIVGPPLERFGASVTGEAFLDDIARNGLLAEAPGGQYAFTHLTFQEYLAARHVRVTPGLVASLAENVGDPWWHETILLYAATADASPIVGACLARGTIVALTLAFDCEEASAEIDPELRQRLDAERRRAFEPGCPPEHRRLIAGVMAARLVRRTITTARGTLVCARPVPADLYWLFLRDTGAPEPDQPCLPQAGQAAIGVWGAEARALVAWLNAITATATGIEIRLPSRDELGEEPVARALGDRLPAPVTSAWTQPGPELWLRPGQPHPHELTGAALRQAIADDARNTALLPQILLAAVLDVVLAITRDLDDIRALTSALDGDLAARADSGGRVVDLMHAHAHAIVLTYDHAAALTGTAAITQAGAADPDLVTALGLGPARAMADAIARDLTDALTAARARAAELADAIDLDLKVLSAFDYDLGQTLNLHRRHASALDRARKVAGDVPGAADLGLARVPDLDPAFPLPGVLGLPVRWIAGGPLARTLLQVLAARAPGSDHAALGDPCQAFARALTTRAGIPEETWLRADLGRPLTAALRELAAAGSPAADSAAGWKRATGLRRLAEACAPLSGAHQAPDPAEAAALRAVALALADDGDGDKDAPGLLRTVAATVTVVENRSKGLTVPGEAIIVARV
jgi:hypothetical protein